MRGLPTRKIFSTYRHLLRVFYHHRRIHISPDTVVIASAVRTPWGTHEGKLSSIKNSQLGSLALEAAVKQSAAPVEQLKHIFMAETLQQKTDDKQNFDFSKFLRKAHYTSLTTGEEYAKTILMALEALKDKQVEFLVVGGMEPETKINLELLKNENSSVDLSKHNFAKSLEKYLKAQKDGLFDEELVPVTVLQQSGKRKIAREITQDEDVDENLGNHCGKTNYSKGAAALVLTTFATAQKYKLTPLTIIKNFEHCNDPSKNASIRKCVANLLFKSKLEPEHIHHWEMDENLPPPINNLDMKLINPHGGTFIFGQSTATSLPRMLAHLSHSLKPYQCGCVIINNSNEYFALIIEKIPFPLSPGVLPKLTLYTKNPCHLCDILLEELELKFSGEYELEKVFIDTKENVRFLRLYRHDIPVVFLNGQFLCMHRINTRLLRRKLDLLKKQ